MRKFRPKVSKRRLSLSTHLSTSPYFSRSPRVKTQISFVTLWLFWPTFKDFLWPFYDFLTFSKTQPKPYQVKYCNWKTNFQWGRRQKTLFKLYNHVLSCIKEYIITLNFNITQAVKSSHYCSEFTKNCSHLFFFARQSLFSFSSFCKSSSIFVFSLSLPQFCSGLVVLALYFSGCFSLQLLVWYLLVPNQLNHLQQIYSPFTAQFWHQF